MGSATLSLLRLSDSILNMRDARRVATNMPNEDKKRSTLCRVVEINGTDAERDYLHHKGIVFAHDTGSVDVVEFADHEPIFFCPPDDTKVAACITAAAKYGMAAVDLRELLAQVMKETD